MMKTVTTTSYVLLMLVMLLLLSPVESFLVGVNHRSDCVGGGRGCNNKWFEKTTSSLSRVVTTRAAAATGGGSGSSGNSIQQKEPDQQNMMVQEQEQQKKQKQQIQVNDKIPFVSLHYGFPPQFVNMASYTAGKRVIVVGLPGAFTPTCSSIQIPSYINGTQALKDELNIDVVIIISVNDGAVMSAWARQQNITDSLLVFLGDPFSEFTKEIGMELMNPLVYEKGLVGPRCKRFAMYIENSVVKYVAVSESDTDPAGDNDPTTTCCPAILDAIRNLTTK